MDTPLIAEARRRVGPGLIRLRSYVGEARQAVRVAVGCALAFSLYHALNLPQGYWAVFTVVIVMQGSIGGTVSAALDRMKGTLLGAAVGALAAVVRPQTPVGLGAALAVSVLVTAFVAARRPTLKVAPVTAVIMLISPTGAALGPLESAGFRVIEIFIGSVIGVLTSVLVLPARSERVVLTKIGVVLNALAGLADRYAEDVAREGIGPDRHLEHAGVRAGLAAVEAAMADAARERSSRLSDHRLPEALPRTLWRVRNDLAAVGRAVAATPEAVREAFAPGAARMLEAQASFMRRCAEGLQRRVTIDRAGRQAVLETFDAGAQGLRQAGITRNLGFEAAGPVFALVFALDSLHRNLGDLADRIDETTRGADLEDG